MVAEESGAVDRGRDSVVSGVEELWWCGSAMTESCAGENASVMMMVAKRAKKAIILILCQRAEMECGAIEHGLN